MNMKKELPHVQIGSSYGGSQDWFTDRMLYLGGCAAVTAGECFLYFDLCRGTHLCPAGVESLSRKDYTDFIGDIKPYLRPRWGGVDRLELFTQGASAFLRDRGETRFTLEELPGTRPLEEAKQAVVRQLEAGFPIPYLNLHHRNPAFRDYVWHWFFLNGYERYGDTFMVKAVTYGSWRYLDLEALWNTGHRRRGGMILWEET